MTRWARVTTTRSKRPLAATSWEDMKKGSLEGEDQNLPKSRQLEANRLSAKNDTPQAKHKKNKKKKEYLNEDVNGFLEYLRQNPQMVHNGERIATDSQEVREEIAVALKKDSRREGRRLKRQAAKKNAMVCFHCRKPGHGIADCPAALDNQDMGTGICYRCGSTEHEITKCKAKVDPALGEFPFAKCFVCGEMGHLSRSCPDNPKGLYADGGCCRLCGSVEHFKKDCPESQNSEEDGLHYIVASETEIMEVEFEFSLLGGLPFPNDKTDKQMLYNFTDRMVTVGRWAMGMSADYEEILDVPEPQKPKTKIPKVVNF